MRFFYLLCVAVLFSSCCRTYVAQPVSFNYTAVADSVDKKTVTIYRLDLKNYDSEAIPVTSITLNEDNNYTADFQFGETDIDYSFIVKVEGTNFSDTINEISYKKTGCSFKDFEFQLNNVWYDNTTVNITD